MSFADIKQAIVGFVQANMAAAEPVVFAMGFAEGIPGLSLLVPSSALFLGIGALHSAAGGAFWTMWLAASVGAFIGDVVVYGLARRFERDVQDLPLFRRRSGWLEQGRRLFDRWGVLAVVIGKFTGFLRPFMPAVAGIVRMPLVYFLPASAVSSLAWAGVFLSPGYGFNWLFF